MEEKVLKARMFTIVQFERNPKTGEDLGFSEVNILTALQRKSIKEYAYILHDKDTWTQDAFDRYVKENGDEPDWQVGEYKPRHWHTVIKCSPAIDVKVIAKWFDVPVQAVQVKIGKGTFLDCIEYLTHEHERQQGLGKYRYADEEVKSNIDWRKQLETRFENRLKYGGKDLSHREQIRADVLQFGRSLKDVAENEPLAYQQDFTYLEKCRIRYLTLKAPLPATRINFYIFAEQGEKGSGIGKGLLSKALARALYPNLKDDGDIFFEVGEGGALFDGYDGQPVIIWNDKRGGQILNELGGKVGAVYNVFDTTPTSSKQNIKYGSVKLINAVNIVNSVQSYDEFLDGISGRDSGIMEDTRQAKRRFPFIMPMRFEDFDVMINKGFMDDTDEFDQYIKYVTITANMQRIQIRGGGNREVIQQAEAKLLEPIVEKHEEFKKRRTNVKKDVTVDEILEGTDVKVHKPMYKWTTECAICGHKGSAASSEPNYEMFHGTVQPVISCSKCEENNELPFDELPFEENDELPF